MFLTLELFYDLVSFGFTNLLLKMFNYTKIKFTSSASHCHLSRSSSVTMQVLANYNALFENV